MKTDLELALECIVNVYHQYAVKSPPIDDYLNKTEFSQLLKESAEPFLRRNTTPGLSIDKYISQLFSKADKNHDGRLKFTEFLTTLSGVVIDAHRRFHESQKRNTQQAEAGQGHDHGHDQDHGRGPNRDQDHGHGHGPIHDHGPNRDQDHGHGHGPIHDHGPNRDQDHGHGHGPIHDRGRGPSRDQDNGCGHNPRK